MKTMQEHVQEAVEKVAPKTSPENKKKCEQVLSRMLTEDVNIPEALGINRETLDVLYAHAHQLYMSGQYKDAAAAFALIATMDTRNAIYQFALGACHQMLKDYENAFIAYKASYYLDVTNPMPLYHLSDCCMKLGRIEDAIVYLGLAVVRAGDNPHYAKIKERALMMQQGLIDEIRREAKGQKS